MTIDEIVQISARITSLSLLKTSLLLTSQNEGWSMDLGSMFCIRPDAFHVQVRFGKYIFLAFFAGFSPGST